MSLASNLICLSAFEDSQTGSPIPRGHILDSAGMWQEQSRPGMDGELCSGGLSGAGGEDFLHRLMPREGLAVIEITYLDQHLLLQSVRRLGLCD